MGGDHHGHAKIKIPDYKVYKVEAVPELMAVQRALANKGLKDPWLRYVFRRMFIIVFSG
jgi:NADH dehydrogenase (ubiquinone) 1 beta subcomplex subunit 3